jgi:hypothetical protein
MKTIFLLLLSYHFIHAMNVQETDIGNKFDSLKIINASNTLKTLDERIDAIRDNAKSQKSHFVFAKNLPYKCNVVKNFIKQDAQAMVESAMLFEIYKCNNDKSKLSDEEVQERKTKLLANEKKARQYAELLKDYIRTTNGFDR